MFQNASRSAEHDDGPSIPPELWKPEDLVDRRVDVHGLGRGLVVDFEKSPLFSDSLHTIEFDDVDCSPLHSPMPNVKLNDLECRPFNSTFWSADRSLQRLGVPTVKFVEWVRI